METFNNLFSNSNLYVVAGIFGGLTIGIIGWIIFKVVKAKKEADYEPTDRVKEEQKRIEELQKGEYEGLKPPTRRSKKIRDDKADEQDRDQDVMSDGETTETDNAEQFSETEDASEYEWDYDVPDDADFDIKDSNEV